VANISDTYPVYHSSCCIETDSIAFLNTVPRAPHIVLLLSSVFATMKVRIGQPTSMYDTEDTHSISSSSISVGDTRSRRPPERLTTTARGRSRSRKTVAASSLGPDLSSQQKEEIVRPKIDDSINHIRRKTAQIKNCAASTAKIANNGCVEPAIEAAGDCQNNCMTTEKQNMYSQMIVSKFGNPCLPEMPNDHGDSIVKPSNDWEGAKDDHERERLEIVEDEDDNIDDNDEADQSSITHFRSNSQQEQQRPGSQEMKSTTSAMNRFSSKAQTSQTSLRFQGETDLATTRSTQPRQTSKVLSRHPASSSSWDLVVRVGNQEFHHSSAILAYASEYLKQQMEVRTSFETWEGGNNTTRQSQSQNQTYLYYYYIDFSHHSADEWKTVLEFLQPRSLGITALSWQTVPIVLPWFAQFELDVLLKDVDRFLLETIVTQTVGTMTLHNLILLTKISHGCNLHTTKSQARQWLRTKLLEPQKQQRPSHKSSSSPTFNGVEQSKGASIESLLDWEMPDLQSLSECLTEYADLRDYVWESAVIVYLPHDLNVEDSHYLVSNPLFPYILREGMMQLCILHRAESLVKQHNQQFEDEDDSLCISGSKPTSTSTDSDFYQVEELLSSSPDTTTSSDSSGSFRRTLKPDRLSQDMLSVLLRNIMMHLEQFEQENEVAVNRKHAAAIAEEEKEAVCDQHSTTKPGSKSTGRPLPKNRNTSTRQADSKNPTFADDDRQKQRPPVNGSKKKMTQPLNQGQGCMQEFQPMQRPNVLSSSVFHGNSGDKMPGLTTVVSTDAVMTTAHGSESCLRNTLNSQVQGSSLQHMQARTFAC
jgi:hypothetical protein